MLDRHIVKPEAAFSVARSHGWEVNPYFPPSLRDFARRLLIEDPLSSQLSVKTFGDEERIEPGGCISLTPPIFLNGFPSSFGSYPAPTEFTVPAFDVLRVRNGTLKLVQDAPAILDEEGNIHPQFSSFYFPLLPHYAPPPPENEATVHRVNGRLLVLLDDVGGLNYCHWLVDWLPRLRALGADRPDLHVAILNLEAQWQRETLAAFGITEDRIVSLQPWEAVQAQELIVPAHLSEVFHPAYKGSGWALDALNRALAPAHEERPARPGRKIFFSRSDARVRHIANEEELFAALKPLGYEKIVASGLTVRQQAEIFNHAASVISLHGAGLSNIVFCRPGTKVLEIVPSDYGMPTFWLLASGAKLEYTAYTADSVSGAGINQHEDVMVDVKDFMHRAAAWLDLP